MIVSVSKARRPLWLAGLLLAVATAALGQGAPPGPHPVSPAPVAPVARTSELIPEGTDVEVRTEDRLSSQTSADGDEFTIVTDEPIRLADGAVIPAGYAGRGEVVAVRKKGMLGKGGELNVQLDYFRIGDTRVHLRANKGQEGGDTTGTTVALTVLVTPLFLMHHGHPVVFPKGMKINAVVDADATVPLPLPPPPQAD